MGFRTFDLAAAAVLAASLASAAPAAPAIPQTDGPAAAPAPYEVTGFRSARFGMTPAQVRAAIAADFPGARITETTNPAERTRILQALVERLQPASPPATLTYIFGATADRLASVNVVWTLAGDPSPEERAALADAAVQLARYFRNLPRPRATVGATPLGPNRLLIFGAVDGKGGAVELTASGISYAAGANATPSPPPSGPASLRISYMANVANPDVYRLKPGSF